MPRLRTILLAAALCGGCLDAGDDPAIETTTQSTTIGTIYQNGTQVVFDDVAASGLDLAAVGDITACDENAMYASVTNGSTWTLFFTNDAGNPVGSHWSSMGSLLHGPRIACDHAMLANLDGAGELWFAPITSNGPIAKNASNVDQWTVNVNLTLMNRIQGGDGMFYGVANTVLGNNVYLASNQATGANPAWGLPIAKIGAIEVTGTGAVQTGTDHLIPNKMIAWPRAAYALEPTGTIDTNNRLLDGVNTWGSLDTGGERYTTITAAASNVIYGLETKPDGVHLGRISIHETSCTDGIDNDHNGLTDAEDPACYQAVANAFCLKMPDGNYCSSRYQPVTFLDQSNQSTSLTQCSGGVAVMPLKFGVCINTGGNSDFIRTQEQSVQPEQPGEGHYCNIVYTDGTWDFEWNGPTPCDTITARHPGQLGHIVRSGLYSPKSSNNVFVRCNNGGWGPLPIPGIGAGALQTANNAVGHTNNQCVFQVSPVALPMFDKMLDTQIGPPRTANPSVHNHSPVDTTQFGDPAAPMSPVTSFGTVTANGVDTNGKNVGQRENAYDLPLDESRPLYAPATGTVLIAGSRIRDVTAAAAGGVGTPNQGELYVLYEVGSDSKYRESFVVYYAHVRRRLVVDGQTVKSGQILGYVGATGSTGGYAHLHVGVMRVSNTNAHTSSSLQLGWRQAVLPDNTLSGMNTGGIDSVDPLGWNNPFAADPGAYLDWATGSGPFVAIPYTGWGAWSPMLFKPGAAFHYP